MNRTYPIADWHMSIRDLDRGLLGHLLGGYNTRFVKGEFATDHVDDLDAGAKAA